MFQPPCRDMDFRCYIASDAILAKKGYASEKDIILPDAFLPVEAVKASAEYGWRHPTVSYGECLVEQFIEVI